MILDCDSYSRRVPEIAALFRRCFHREVDPEFLHWRYLRNPVGEVLACVEEEGGKPIANYSASPCWLSIGGRRVLSALSMTTMTDPAHAGKGLFARLATECYTHMTEAGYALIWGFPNAQSHPGCVRRLHWVDIAAIPTLVRHARDPEPGPKPRFDHRFEFDYDEIETLGDAVQVAKPGSYLSWRYAEHPVNRYENLVITSGERVSSHCVVKRFGQGLDLVDVRASDPDQASTLVTQAIALARDRGLEVVRAWALPHRSLRGVLDRLGFHETGPVTRHGARVLEVDATWAAVVAEGSGWDLQMGDSDVY